MGSKILNATSVASSSQLDPRKIFGVLSGEWFQKSKTEDVPFFIEAQPTDICNFACHYCSYAFRREDSDHASWDLETAIRFAEFVRNEPVRALAISGGGEPLSWKYMPEFLERLGDTPDLRKMLITNGSLIEKKVPPDLLQDFSLILVSIASTDLNAYQQTMRGAALSSHTLENVLRLPSLFHKPGPDLNVCVVVTRTNDQHLDRIAVDLLERGFDFVYFKAEYNYEPLGERLSHDRREQIRGAKFQLPRTVAERTNLLVFPQDSEEKEAQGTNDRPECINLQHLLHVIINAVGDVYPCVPRIGNPIYSLGNIRTSQSMEQLKNLLHARQALQKIILEYRDGQCGRCRFKKYNDLVLEAERAGMPSSMNGNYKHPDFI
jgi:radical SAM protein with 4Fe4S-binding SPASM domain